MSGKLYVIATPIGNLDDLSGRALSTLRSVDCILCEDTRKTSKLLARYAIKTPTLSCHRFNEHERCARILERIEAGEEFALVSDGGTPAVSDPGRILVAAAIDRGHTVTPIPGPSAPATLLSVAGLPADRFVFEGFLPHRGGERRRRIRELRGEARTVVIFESPHRIGETLDDIAEILGSRQLVLGRELTKAHETILRGDARQVADALGKTVRGEICLALEPADPHAGEREPGAERVLAVWRECVASESSRRDALRRAARELGLKRAALFRQLAELGEDAS